MYNEQNQQPTTSAPQNLGGTQMPMSEPKKSKTAWGPLIGLIIILILIIAGSFYFFRSEQQANNPENTSADNIENELMELQTQSQSDEVSDIEADLEATNLDNIDAEISMIEDEIE